MDVYLQGEVDDHITVLQYPLSSRGRGPDRGELVGAYYKEGQRSLALQYEGGHAWKLKSNLTPCATSYAMAMVKDHQLVLVPIHAVMQMRPDFAHLDHREGREEVAKDEPPPEEEPQALQVQFKKFESDRAKVKRLTSKTHLEAMQQEEVWKPLEIVREGVEVERKVDQILTLPSLTDIPFPAKKEDYLAFISPDVDLGDDQKNRALLLSIKEIRSLNVKEGVEVILRQCQVVLFETMLEILGQPPSDAMLYALSHRAIWVCDRWVAKSTLVCEGNTAVEAARDKALLLFHQRGSIHLGDFAIDDQVGFLADKKKILRRFAVFKSKEVGWTLKGKQDAHFLTHYPQVAQQFGPEFWGAFARQVDEGLRIYGQRTQARALETDPSIVERQLRECVVSKLSQVGVCTLQGLLTHFHQLYPSSRVEEPMLQAVLPTITGSIRNGYYMRNAPQELMQVRKHALALFQIKNDVRKAEVISAFASSHAAKPKASLLNRVMDELGHKQSDGQVYRWKAASE